MDPSSFKSKYFANHLELLGKESLGRLHSLKILVVNLCTVACG